MHISILEFGSRLSYSPHGTSQAELASQKVTRVLKRDEFVRDPSSNSHILMSEFLAQEIQRNLTNLRFASFFIGLVSPIILIPIPKSSLMKSDEWWVPRNLATALVRRGLGNAVEECLERFKPVATAHAVQPKDRPTALQHYESLRLKPLREGQGKLREIILIDDVVTSGSAFLGAANQLADKFPDARIRALAMMRTISNSSEFVSLWASERGTITLRDNHRTHREP